MLRSTKYKILEKGKYTAEKLHNVTKYKIQNTREGQVCSWGDYQVVPPLPPTCSHLVPPHKRPLLHFNSLSWSFFFLSVWLIIWYVTTFHSLYFYLCLVLASVLFWAAFLCLSFQICLCVFSSFFVWSDYQRLWASVWSTGHYLKLKLALITSPVSVHCVK